MGDVVADRRAKRLRLLTGRCVHFTGIQHDECKAGVRYDDLRPPTPVRRVTLPCLRRDEAEPPPCAERRWPTPEEAEVEEAEREAHLQEFLAKVARGECAICGADVEPREQVGRCIYAACGHRIGQGTLKVSR